MQFIRRIRMSGLLSFPVDMEPLDLQPLNVLLGPNGSGKTNLIEAFELLRATPTDFAAAIRHGGGASEWLWKGENPAAAATVELETARAASSTKRPLRYRLEFSSSDNDRVKVLDEAIEDMKPNADHGAPDFHYRFRRGRPVVNVKGTEIDSKGSKRQLKPNDLLPNQSILSQLKEPDHYPEITWIGGEFEKVQAFRDCGFGPNSALSGPQRTDYPSDKLLPGGENFALVLNEILHRGGQDIDAALKRFLPRYERISTRIAGNTVQLYLHERGLKAPIPSTRISDGTLRFLAVLAALFSPTPPSLMCLEEPELGLHPDAVSLLADLLVEASHRVQLVVTTHSDALLSSLSDQVESVVVCENYGHGTTFKRLNAERLAHWLEDYTFGDIWRMGEIGGNP